MSTDGIVHTAGVEIPRYQIAQCLRMFAKLCSDHKLWCVQRTSPWASAAMACNWHCYPIRHSGSLHTAARACLL